MYLRADLHIHSKYSRAASRDLDLEHLALWAWQKGIHILGTGDFTHPAWFTELQEKLVPTGDGLFQLQPDVERRLQKAVPASLSTQPIRFMLTVEISTTFERPGLEKPKKLHQLVCVPGWEEAKALQQRLDREGNLNADGRPLLTLDARHLLEIVLEQSPHNHLIPTHIFDPWSSLLGMRSGFDSVDDCYGDLTPHIFALETGTSANPAMFRRISSLDRYSCVSHSDAHTPGRMGREATLFNCELTYDDIFCALKAGAPLQSSESGPALLGTIEYFAEESRFFLDGHRSCKVRLHPTETMALQGHCPVCKKPLTLGVQHRIEQLADRPPDEIQPPPFAALLPLERILAEIFELGTKSQKVQRHFHALLNAFGPELDILQHQPLDQLKHAGIPLLTEAIDRMRKGNIVIEPGYDGEYGALRLFQEEESKSASLALFPPKATKEKAVQLSLFSFPKRFPLTKTLPEIATVTQLSLFKSESKPAATATTALALSSTSEPQRESAIQRVDPAPTDVPLATKGAPGAVLETRSISAAGEHLPRVVMAARIPPRANQELHNDQEEAPLLPRIRLMSQHIQRQEPLSSSGLPQPRQLLFMLNTEQRTAVLHQGAPLLLAAGPGTGKTRTMAHRIAYLIAQQQIQPTQQLVLTLTPQAAQELEQEIASLLQHKVELPVYTFAQFCLSLLQEDVDEHALEQDVLPQILTPTESCALLEVLAQKRDRQLPPEEQDLLLRQISWAKQQLLLPDDCAQRKLGTNNHDNEVDDSFLNTAHDAFLSLYQDYQNALRREHLMDADDLIVETVLRLQRDPSYRQKLQRRYLSIHVDEFQDISQIQLQLLRHLMLEHTDLCVAGDPDQAIFQSLGGNVQFLHEFIERFSTNTRKAVRCGLWRNYRTPERGLDAAYALISTLEDPRRIKLLAMAYNTPHIPLIRCATVAQEARYIASTIKALLAGEQPFANDDQWQGEQHPITAGDIVLFVRESAHSQLYRDALLAQDIPLTTTPQRDNQSDDSREATPGKVSLLPLLAAKGREWDIVYIAGCTEPEDLQWPMSTQTQREEITRLLYVGINRARKRIILSYADATTQPHKTQKPLACLATMADYLDVTDLSENEAD